MPTARVLGVYRKSHIPDGPGYQEKYYFTPGDTGFKVWNTKFGAIGAGICWDQWFPESARAMALMGAEVLFYPTAIGSEPPPAPPVDSRDHWRRVMQGHAAANMVPLVASNRIGIEKGQAGEMTFYGSSFIADPTGDIVAELGRDGRGRRRPRPSISTRSRRRAPPGACSATAGRSSIARSEAMTGRAIEKFWSGTMITEQQYEFFQRVYEEEERTSEQLESRGKVYLSIIAAFLAALLLKADDAVKSAKVLGVPWWAVLTEATLFAAALLFVLFALRIRAFEALTDPERIIEDWEEDGPSNEEFFEDRIADYAVAASRNLRVNNRIAATLAVAAWLLVLAMMVLVGIFTFAFWARSL